MSYTIAAAYIRVSTEDQTEYSPAAQLAALQRYADANGIFLDPAHVYRDEGISGRSAAKRPGFQAMISAAKRKDHPFDIILVHKLDRFARSREDSVVYKSMLQRECHVRVVSITEPISDDKTSILMEPILEAMAEYYSVNLGEEVKKGMTQKALSGGLQSTPPFGYLAEHNMLVPDPAAAAYIPQIFQRYVDGQPIYSIARWLNALGLRTHRGNHFENRTVEYILRNPVYVGMLRWNPAGRSRRDFAQPTIITARGKHEPLVSQPLFDAVQRRMDEQKRAHPYKGKPAGVSRKHWLCGIVRCASCGATLILSGAKYGSYFKCNNFIHGRCTTSQHISYIPLEDAVLRQLQDDVDTHCRFVQYRAPRRSPVSSDSSVQRSISAVQRRIDRLREAYLDGAESLDDYKRGKAALEAQLASLRQELTPAAPSNQEAIQSAIQQNIIRILAILSNPAVSVEAKHEAASSLIESILFDRDTNSLRIFYHVA